MHRLLVLPVIAACWATAVAFVAAERDNAAIDDDGHHPEYVAVYSLEATGTHTLKIGVPGGDAFEEDTLEFMVVPSSSGDHEGLEKAEEASEAAWASANLTVASEDSTTPVTPSLSVVYTVSLSGDDHEEQPITVPVEILEAGAYTLLLSHDPDDVPVAVTSPSGETLVPLVVESAQDGEGEEEDEDKDDGPATARQWANALVASFLTSLCSFVGIITVVNGGVARKVNLPLAFLFASGALITTAFVHIIPEAMNKLEGEFSDDFDGMTLRAGIAIMAGLFGGFLLHVALDNGQSHSHSHPNHKLEASAAVAGNGLASGTANNWGALAMLVESSRTVVEDFSDVSENREGDEMEDGRCCCPGSGGGDILTCKQGADKSAEIFTAEMSTVAVVGASNLRDLQNAGNHRGLFDIERLDPVCWNVIVGDLAHNFADGVTIGAAFLGCSSSVGWTVTAASIMHEIPHEVANFVALVNGGMTVTQALVYNFCSALFAVFGVVITLGLRDLITSSFIAYILLLGAGMFIFVGLSELMPDALDAQHGKISGLRTKTRKVLAFAVGALLLGLPLLSHTHCEEGGTAHDHR